MSENTSPEYFTEQLRQELLHRRIVVLNGALDDDNGVMLMTQLMTLAHEDPSRECALWIHSPGGSVPAMLAIRNIMKAMPGGVTTLGLGWAASAGQFLLSAGAPVADSFCRIPKCSCTRDRPGSVAAQWMWSSKPRIFGRPGTPP